MQRREFETSQNKELRWSWAYLGEAFFVNMVHHNYLVVKRPAGPTGAAGEKHTQNKTCLKNTDRDLKEKEGVPFWLVQLGMSFLGKAPINST